MRPRICYPRENRDLVILEIPLKMLLLKTASTFICVFGIFACSLAQNQYPVKSGVLLLYHPVDPSKTTPKIDVWKKVNQNNNLLPNGWSFVNQNGLEEPPSDLFLADISSKELAQYHTLFLSVPGNWPALSPYERETLRSFLEQGGILWIDFSSERGPSEVFYESLPLLHSKQNYVFNNLLSSANFPYPSRLHLFE